ncbi:hypothetical protein SLS60_001349 [Paraconiothyrium brasiliense]|uniref:AAA+ ATPase lid domain-containing protein n=1 Tax=Paraconiothyrium brasiliense TaxID=300254 RepID=A0ABR3S934_9PLEO
MIFLRLMEYYSGILFLTTNRVGDFDEAFTSRIHVSLYYPALNQEKTVKVFTINLDMIEDRFKRKGRVIKIERMEIGGFAAQYFTGHANARWNGRQIRNACQTALALAEFEAQGNSLQETEDRNLVVRLNVKHFEIVRDAYLEFTKYMHDLYGTYAARRAKESKLRAIVIDENANVVASQNLDGTNADPKTAFYLASRNPSGRATSHVPQQSIQIPLDQQHGRYQQQSSTFGTQQPQFQSQQYQPSQYQPQPPYNQPQQQPPLDQNWGQQPRNSGGFGAEPQHEGQFQGSTPRPQQASPSPNRQQQAQTNPPLLDENIRSMYAASGQPGYDQTAPGASGGNRGPSWNCPSCGNLHSGSRSGYCSACG